MSTAERYLLLGLRLGRHVDGIVDAYYGPPELRAAVEADPPVDPAVLAADAEALLDELADGWLRDQVIGLRTYAGALAGESASYADEVEGCYGVRPTWTDEAAFEAAHERLEELLPGDGTLAERHEQLRERFLVPADDMERAVAAAIDVARALTRNLVELPDGEGIDLEIVRDKPWLAFNYYLGGLRSRIAVNVDLPISAADLVELAIHETYPGHHTERCCKEHMLVDGNGLLEETIVMVPAPQSLVSEGIATLAPWLLYDGDGAGALGAVVGDADLGHLLDVERAKQPLEWVSVNASLLLHERGASVAETQEYIERWALMAPKRAAHMIRFMTEPTSRTYVITYAAGRELCTSYVEEDPERFRRLVTQQVRVSDLLQSVN